MKLSLAIDIYVRSRREQGALYINGEEVLRPMCRRLGDQPLEGLSVARVMTYLEPLSRVSLLAYRAHEFSLRMSS